MARDNLPVTAAIRVLREHGVTYVARPYDYEPKGGTAHSAACLGVDEHAVVKTLVMEDEDRKPLVVLMHGDREVSTKALARHVGVPVYMQASILELPKIYINGGRRGLLVEIDPRDAERVLQPQLVDVAIE